MTLRTVRPFIPDIILGALCLLIPAFYNGFPLVTADSGGYISNSYTLFVPIDRPVTYSAFIRVASLNGATLWGVVAAQALVVSALLFTITHHAWYTGFSRVKFIAVMLLMGLATSAGWTAGEIMPDIFTPVMLLSLCILIWVTCSVTARWLLYILILGCMLLHNSNLMMGILLSLLLIAYALRTRNGAIMRAGIILLSISAAGWLSLSAMNAIAGRGFRPSAASHVFIMSRMMENGIADVYVNEHCPTEPSTLCAFKGRLPDRQWVFMWDSGSALYAAGGWQATEAEYTRIIRRTLFTPKYLALHIVKNAEATLRQLPLIYVGDELAQLGPGTSPYEAIEKYSCNELKEYNTSQQQSKNLKLTPWNMLIVVFALATCLTVLLWPGPQEALYGMMRLTIIFLLLNAAITATFGTVVSRYEARVFWVLPFLATLHLVRRMRVRPLN